MNYTNLQKRFLNEIEFDINKPPIDCLNTISSLNEITTNVERSYLHSNLAGSKEERFHIKDVIGTKHPDYAGKTWIEAFSISKRSDSIIKKYYENKEYYEKIKEYDQEENLHDTPLELLKVDDKYIINGGNNRILFLKIKYLTEISNAKSKETKDEINKNYYFVASIRTLPINRKIVHIIMSLESEFKNLSFKNLNYDPSTCNYEVTVNNKVYSINTYQELLNFYKEVYSLKNLKGNTLYEKIIEFTTKYIQSSTILKEVLREIYPSIDYFKNKIIESRHIDTTGSIFESINDDIDLDYIINNIDSFFNKPTIKL